MNKPWLSTSIKELAIYCLPITFFMIIALFFGERSFAVMFSFAVLAICFFASYIFLKNYQISVDFPKSTDKEPPSLKKQ